jgi:hypothetical protein
MPTRTATPAETAAPGVTAPVEAGTLPTTIVPAVVSSAVRELRLFNVARDCRRRETVDRQGVGLTNRAQHGERNRRRGGIDPLSHEALPFIF